jgi:hypothetical protein
MIRMILFGWCNVYLNKNWSTVFKLVLCCFFRITRYNVDVHNTHAHLLLWTHIRKPYPYELLRRIKPADHEIHEATLLHRFQNIGVLKTGPWNPHWDWSYEPLTWKIYNVSCNVVPWHLNSRAVVPSIKLCFNISRSLEKKWIINQIKHHLLRYRTNRHNIRACLIPG